MIFSLLNSSQGFSIPGAGPSPVLAKGFTHRKHKAGTELCQHCRSSWPLEHHQYFSSENLSLSNPYPSPNLNLSLNTARECLKYLRTSSALCKSSSAVLLEFQIPSTSQILPGESFLCTHVGMDPEQPLGCKVRLVLLT